VFPRAGKLRDVARNVKRLFFALSLFCFAIASHGESATDELRAVQLLENAAITRYKASAQADSDRAELDKVAENYEQLVKKYPRDANVREAYGSFLWSIERRSEAFAQWETGEKLDPKDADIAFRLGNAWVDLGDAKKATDYFSRASRLAPRDALYHFNLGNALFLFRHEMHDERTKTSDDVAQRALEEFRTATGLDPFNEDYAKAFADAFYTVPSPDWNEALKAWEHFRDVSANKDFAYTNLARVSLKMGRKEQAREYLARISGKQFDRIKERLTRQLDAAQ